jgi:sugar phosphate isomerase/epimerase
VKSAITLSLTPEAAGAPFVFSGDLTQAFAKASKLGFDAVELFPPEAGGLDSKQIKRLCEENGLRIAAVGSGMGWVKHKLRVTDPDATVRKSAREFVNSIVDVAASLGAPAILGSMQGSWGGGVPREQALGWLREALEEAGRRAETQGVPFLYEFLNRYETNMFNRVAESLVFLQSFEARNIKLLCDLFHMNIEEADIAAALRLAGAKVGHVHFADSNRLAVGMGHTVMKPIVTALCEIGYQGYLSAEVFPVPDSDEAAARTIRSFRELTTDGHR